MNVLTCADTISLNADGTKECSSGWTQHIYTVQFDMSQLTPEIVMTAFTSGFALFAIPYLSTIGIKFILQLLKD